MLARIDTCAARGLNEVGMSDWRALLSPSLLERILMRSWRAISTTVSGGIISMGESILLAFAFGWMAD